VVPPLARHPVPRKREAVRTWVARFRTVAGVEGRSAKAAFGETERPGTPTTGAFVHRKFEGSDHNPAGNAIRKQY